MRRYSYLIGNDQIFASRSPETNNVPGFVIDDHVFCGECTNHRGGLLTGQQTANAEPWGVVASRPESKSTRNNDVVSLLTEVCLGDDGRANEICWI